MVTVWPRCWCFARWPRRPRRREAEPVSARGTTCSGSRPVRGRAGARCTRAGAAAEAASGGGAGNAGRQPASRRNRRAGKTSRTEPAAPAAPAPPQPSACRQALTEEIAIAPSIPDIHGPGGCGGEDLVRLEAVVLPDKRRVALKPAATLRCTMASAIADWVRTDIAPLAAGLGSELSAARQFRLVRMPRPQPRGRRATVRTRPRQRARRARLQARRWPVDRAHRPHRAARVARDRAAFGLRALHPPCSDRARTGITRTTSISI